MNETRSEQGTIESDKELAATNTSSSEIQITKDEFSMLTDRQKFALTEYGYLLSPEDAKHVGILMKNFVGEKGILDFCQSHGTKAYKKYNWLLIGLLAGLIPGLVIFFLTIDAPAGSLYTICIGPAGIVCGIIGASIGIKIEKQNQTTVWVAANRQRILDSSEY